MINRVINKIIDWLSDNYFGLILLIIFFMVAFRRLPGASLFLSVVVLAALFIFVIFIDYIISRSQGERSEPQRGSIIAEGLYICASYYEYMPVMAIVLPALMLLFALFFFIREIFWGRSAYEAAHSSEPQDTPYIKSRRAASFFMGIALVASLLLVGTGGVPLKDYIKNRFVPKGYDTVSTYTLENCGSELLQLENWDSLSLDQRQDLVQLIADIESEYLGLSEQLPVTAGVCDDNVVASFVPQNYSVTIDKLVMMDSTWQAMLQCVLHECYHAYQYQLIGLYYKSPEEYRNLKAFEHVKDYIWETTNYEGDGSYEYQTQALEDDASVYATDRKNVYLQAIQTLKRS